MPAIVELKLRPERTSGYAPTTTQLHGLACVLQSDLMIPDESWRELNEALLLTEFDLQTERRENGYGKQAPGFTGTVVIRLDKGISGEAKHVFAALVRFANFSGTGAQTTHGFGATSVTVI